MAADHIYVAQQAKLLPEQVEDFCAINTEAFPPSERQPCSLLAEDIQNGKRRLFTATHDGILIGFALLLPNVAANIHLLEFLAVDRAWRGKGVGTRLLESIVHEQRAAAAGILIEVESDEAGSAEERPARRRRIEFYVGNGAKFVNCPLAYSAPNQAGGENVSMKLIWLGMRDATPPAGKQLLECIEGIYAKSYYLPESSPLVQGARSAFARGERDFVKRAD